LKTALSLGLEGLTWVSLFIVIAFMATLIWRASYFPQ
jgi:hypothetical protein